jgi:hypothetical protein
LEAVQVATQNRRPKLLTSGAQLDRLLSELDGIIATDPNDTTVSALIDVSEGLKSTAPELVDALHQAIERRQHPGGQAVGVHRHRHAFIVSPSGAQFARHIGLHGLPLSGKPQQHLARFGESQRARAHHQQLAHLGLQRPEPLRNR